MIAEELFEAPLMLEFNSDERNGKYYRIGADKEYNDAIYRIGAKWDLSNLTIKEKLKLVQQYDRQRI